MVIGINLTRFFSPFACFCVRLAIGVMILCPTLAYAQEFGEKSTYDLDMDNLLGSVLYADSGVSTAKGELQILKFVDNSKTQAVVPVNQLQRLPTPQSRLVVRLMECRKDYQDKSGNDIAWLDIFFTDISGVLADDADPVFSGWIWRQFPSVSTLQHPQFDIRLLSCVADKQK